MPLHRCSARVSTLVLAPLARWCTIVALLACTASLLPCLTHAEDVPLPLDQVQRADGALVVPDHFLRGWDPVTVFFPADTGPAQAGPEDHPERFVTLQPRAARRVALARAARAAIPSGRTLDSAAPGADRRRQSQRQPGPAAAGAGADRAAGPAGGHRQPRHHQPDLPGPGRSGRPRPPADDRAAPAARHRQHRQPDADARGFRHHARWSAPAAPTSRPTW